MEEKHVVTEDFFMIQLWIVRVKTTTTIGNGVSLPHGSPTAVNESKVGIAILKIRSCGTMNRFRSYFYWRSV